MDEIAGIINADFIIGTGDNFYNPDGVFSVDDPAWNSHWRDIYKDNSKKYIKNLIWYSTLGNHDLNSPDIYAEFIYG